LAVAAPGVLSNDTDIEGGTLTVAVVTGPAHGTLTLTANGGYDYDPADNYTGADSFTYQTSDGTDVSNVATVSLTVTAVNDAPVAVADAGTTAEDTLLAVAAPGVLSNDTDIEGGTLTAVLDVAPSSGTLTLNPDGSYNYSPAANFHGVVSFTYHAYDGTAASNSATVTITVDSVIDDSFATWLAIYGLVGNPGEDPDHDGINNAVEFVIGGNPKDRSDVGLLPKLSLVNADPDGNLAFTDYLLFTYRRTEFAKNDDLTTIGVDWSTNLAAWANTQNAPGVVVVDEGNHEAEAGVDLVRVYIPRSLAVNGKLFARLSVFIDVPHVNNAPVALPQILSVDENTPLPITLAATDSNNDPLSYNVTVAPLHGSLTGTGANRIYTPVANYSGTDSFTFVANDGTENSLPVTVSITVNAVNDFVQWMDGFNLVASPGTDSDQDSISNAVEYVIGGNPADHNDVAFLPKVSMVSADPDGNLTNEDYLLFTYRRTDLSKDDPSTTIKVEWNTSFIGSWTNAQGSPGVHIIVLDNVELDSSSAPGVDLVKVYIPRALAANGKLFARLTVTVAVP
ncbi:MAG: Ig-like domain-containing protein, partial [Verrucomicrobiota bacterium]